MGIDGEEERERKRVTGSGAGKRLLQLGGRPGAPRMVQTKLLQPRGGVAVADALLYKHELDIDLPIWFADDRTLELSDPFELGSDRFFPDSSQGKSRSGSDSLRNVAKQVKVKSQKVAKGGRDAKKVNSSSSAGGSDGSNGTAVHTGT